MEGEGVVANRVEGRRTVEGEVERGRASAGKVR